MTSIYQTALGDRFADLHPQIRRRFGFSSADRMAAVGSGVMEEIWHGPIYTLPFLALGMWRHIMFPCRGANVPFRIENYAYVDTFGRETVTWIRTFEFPGGPLRFDATMIYSRTRRRVVDYLGTHQHLAVDIHLGTRENGGLALRSGEQRFYEGPVAFRFPMLFSGVANVSEWYDAGEDRFRIEVAVENRVWGKLFGYRGWFNVAWIPCGPGEIPAHVRPIREERRE